MDGIHRTSGMNKIPSSGAGYIIIPGNVSSREDYISQAYAQERVSIYIEDVGYFPSVKITRTALREIEFPENIGEYGSGIIYLNAYKNNLIVIDVMSKNNESLLLDEDSFTFKKVSKSDSSSLSISKKGFLLLQASKYIKLISREFLLKCIDIITIDSDKKVSINSKESIELGVKDLEPALKGDISVEKISDLIDNTSAINDDLGSVINELVKYANTQTTAAGSIPTLAPLVPAYQALSLALIQLQINISNNSGKLTTVKQDLDSLKSKLVKIG